MNEEEKQAVEDSKDILKELNKHKDKDFIGRLYYKNKPIEDVLQILLKLIEKQQKEIEELKSEFAINTEIHKRDLKIKELKEINECLHQTDKELFVSKDKIREIIGKYVDIEEHLVYHHQELWGTDLAEMIKELLGE